MELRLKGRVTRCEIRIRGIKNPLHPRAQCGSHSPSILSGIKSLQAQLDRLLERIAYRRVAGVAKEQSARGPNLVIDLMRAAGIRLGGLAVGRHDRTVRPDESSDDRHRRTRAECLAYSGY